MSHLNMERNIIIYIFSISIGKEPAYPPSGGKQLWRDDYRRRCVQLSFRKRFYGKWLAVLYGDPSWRHGGHGPGISGQFSGGNAIE